MTTEIRTEAKDILIAGTGALFAARFDPDRTLPASYDDEIDGDFFQVGLTTKDGAKWKRGRTIRETESWQEQGATRVTTTKRSSELSLTMQEWNADNLLLSVGGTVEPAGDGVVHNPPEPNDNDEWTTILLVEDGDKIDLIVHRRCSISGDIETAFGRENEAELPITVTALYEAGEKAWQHFSNHIEVTGS